MHSERHVRRDRGHGKSGEGTNKRAIYHKQTKKNPRYTAQGRISNTQKHHRKYADQTQTAQMQPSGGNNAQESPHSADRGNIVLVYPVDVIPRGEIDVAVNHPRL
jgi:hypothetical protein